LALVALSVVEQRLDAVRAALSGAKATEVAAITSLRAIRMRRLLEEIKLSALDSTDESFPFSGVE
jgi:hypothetical protein